MILGIESSCDESAMALWCPETGIRGEWVHTQLDVHREYGGIVPDLASREHLRNLPAVLRKAQKSFNPGDLQAIAVTRGPGLAGCLALGIAAARALSVAWRVPVYGVNHLRGHAWSPFIGIHERDPNLFDSSLDALLPHLGLLVSGGNTLLFQIAIDRTISVRAQTIDDSAGEALDKGAKLLGMPYPGGPLIEEHAATGSRDFFSFPRSFSRDPKPCFSFSGLKTSLRYTMERMEDAELENRFADLCASYQEAVVDALVTKTRQFLRKGEWNSLGLSGGVANNKRLQEAIVSLGNRHGCPALIARPAHTGDNATMIAFASWADPSACVCGNVRESGKIAGEFLQPSLPLV